MENDSCSGFTEKPQQKLNHIMTKKVKLALVDKDTDLKRIAAEIGVSGQFLSMLLSGKRRSKTTLAALARHLGMSVPALQKEIQSTKEARHVTTAHSPKHPRPPQAQRPALQPALSATPPQNETPLPLH